ncbi:MAG TPA: SIS domain-containing protein, partial [Devosia sp.]|nr:SIS domain-containing protein [Devosia sp.]
MSETTHMQREIEEIPEATRRLLAEGEAQLRAAGEALRAKDPAMIATIARGSSDHASAFLKYSIELVAGIPVASIGPSVVSIYGRELKLDRCAAIAISQSGKSPDIVAMEQAARRGGALCIALTNTAGSPLAMAADLAVDLRAGAETSVAATKSFVSSVVAGLGILGHWTGDEALLAALQALPDAFGRAVTRDWTPFFEPLKGR